MNQSLLWKFAIVVLIGFIAWGPAFSTVLDLINPQASQLSSYLLSKGLFAMLLLVALARWGGLKWHGFERGRNWWFLIPGAPFLVLTFLVVMNPEAPWGLSLAAAFGWVMVSIFVAIGEEGVFRGVLWRAVEHRGMVQTSILTSVLFGAVHLLGLFSSFPAEIILSQAIFAAGVGMMFAAVRLVSGTLMAPLVLHAVFDAGALVAAGGVQEMFSDTMSVGRLLVPGLIFFVWGLACVLIIQRRRSSKP